jgi:glycosyltransferase involved in cell wall biosynthesis
MNDMMITHRILFILHLPPPVHGAAMVGKYIKDSELINSEFDCRYVNLATAANLEDIGKVGLKKLFSFLRLLREIRRQVKSFKPSLVYITPNAKGGAFYKDFVVVERLKVMGCRVVAHYHNKGVAMRQDQWLDNWLYRHFFKGLKVILLAEVLYHDVEKYVSKRNVFVCPNGIPDIQTQRVISPSERQKGDVPRLLFLSNLIVSKGVLVLLGALRMVKEKGYSVACDFVGGETAELDSRKFQEEVTKRQLQGVAVYHGKKYGDEKEEFWCKAEAFVFPTFYPNECFPLVILEAMQHALPCVSTNEGAIPGMVEEGRTGFVVERQSSEATADAICKLLDSAELRKRMGTLGRQRYEQLFTLQAFERRMCDILRQLVS